MRGMLADFDGAAWFPYILLGLTLSVGLAIYLHQRDKARRRKAAADVVLRGPKKTSLEEELRRELEAAKPGASKLAEPTAGLPTFEKRTRD